MSSELDAGSEPDPSPRAGRPRRRLLRRLVGLSTALLLVAIQVLLLAVATRDHWLTWAARQAVAAALPADVAIEVTDLQVPDLSPAGRSRVVAHVSRLDWRADDGTALALRDVTCSAWLDLPRLLAGDPTGVHQVRVRARELRVRLPIASEPTAAAPVDEPFGWPAPARLLPFTTLCPQGLRIDIASVVVTDATGAEQIHAPLSVSLTAAPQRRVDVLGSAATGSVWLPTAADAHLRLEGRVDTPTEFADRFGLRSPLRGGALSTRLVVAADRLQARVDWRDVLLDEDLLDQGPGNLGGTPPEAELSTDLLLLRAPTGDIRLFADADLDLPGLRLHTEDLELPIAAGDAAPAWTDLRGAVSLSVVDLDPWRPWLPTEVQEWLPLRGVLRGRLDDGGLDVDAGHIATDGARLIILDGRLPAVALRTDPGARVEARVELTQPRRLRWGDGPLDHAELQGRAELLLHGSLAAPRIAVDLDLDAGRAAGFGWRTLQAAGGVHLDADGTSWWNVAAFDIVDLYAASPGDPPPGEAALGVRTSGALHARLGVTDTMPVLSGTGQMSGRLGSLAALLPEPDRALLSTLAAERVEWQLEDLFLSPCAAPRGRLRARVDGLRLTETRPATDLDLQASARGAAELLALHVTGRFDPLLLDPLLRTGPGESAARSAGVALDPATLASAEPVPFEVDAHGRWAGDGLPRGSLMVAVDQIAAPGFPTGSAFLAVESTQGMLAIPALAIRGAINADGQGRLLLGADPVADLELRASLVNAAALRALWPQLPEDLEASAEISLHGPLEHPDLHASADLSLPPGPLRDLLLPWPEDAELRRPDGPLRLAATLDSATDELLRTRLQVWSGEPEQDGAWLALESHGSLPLRFDPDAGRLVPAVGGSLEGSLRAASSDAQRRPIRLLGTTHWDGQSLRIDRVALTTDELGLRGDAALGLGLDDLITAVDPAAALSTAPLQADLRLDRFELESLPMTLSGGEDLVGNVDGWLRITGSVDAPQPSGRLTLRDGRLRVATDVPTLDHVTATLELDDRQLRLRDARGQLGIGQVDLDGSLSWPMGEPLQILGADCDVRFTARDALLLRGTGLKLRADADLRLRGRLGDRLDLTGDLGISSAKLIRRISLVPEFGTRGGASVSTGLPLFELPDPFGADLRFDVAVRSTGPLQLQTYICDLDLDAALKLRGTGVSPFLEGAVSARDGVLRLPALAMTVDRAVLNFDGSEPRHPRVAIRASSRRHGIDLRATATGRLDQLEILLSSLPPLTQQELYALVSTGVLPDTLRREGLQGRVAMVGGYVASEILDFYFGSDSTERGPGVADRFHFEAGREISRGGVESLIVDFDLDDRFALRGERDIYEDYNMGLVYRFRF